MPEIKSKHRFVANTDIENFYVHDLKNVQEECNVHDFLNDKTSHLIPTNTDEGLKSWLKKNSPCKPCPFCLSGFDF